MDVDQAQEEEDRFLAFEDYARSALSLEPEEDQDQAPNGTDPRPVGLGGAGSHLGSSRLALLIPAVLPPQFYSLISLRCADDMERHLEDRVLSKLPDNYPDIVKQSIISMVSEDSFV